VDKLGKRINKSIIDVTRLVKNRINYDKESLNSDDQPFQQYQ